VDVIKISTDSDLVVDNIKLDDNQDGSYELPDFGSIWDQLVFAVSNQNSSGPAQYSYNSSLITATEYFNEVPVEFGLKQNYPNPFSGSGGFPETTIEFSIPSFDNPAEMKIQASPEGSGAFVKITVFDILGREVEKLVEGYKSSGTHKVTFNASSLPSGTYFYLLKSGEFSDIKKMILLK
jgi:hypothetical protein